MTLYETYLTGWNTVLGFSRDAVTAVRARYRTTHAGREAAETDIGHALYAMHVEGKTLDDIWPLAPPSPGPLPNVRVWRGNHFANTEWRDFFQFPWTCLGWPRVHRDAMLTLYAQDGYTHLALTPWMTLKNDWDNGSGGRVVYPHGSGSYDWRNDLGRFADLCREVEAHGINPVVFLNYKENPIALSFVWKRFVARLLLRYHPPALCLGWETNTIPGFMSGESDHLDIYRWLRSVYDGPIYDHFSPGRDAATKNMDPIEWRRRAVEAGLTGTLMQYDDQQDPDTTLVIAYHLPAPHGLPSGHCGRSEGQGLGFILFEGRRDLEGYQQVVAGIPDGRGHGYG